MKRFLKLKDIYENHGGKTEDGLILRLTWWEDDHYLCYTEEYDGYGTERTVWQIDKKEKRVRHTGYRPTDCWTEWEADE